MAGIHAWLESQNVQVAQLPSSVGITAYQTKILNRNPLINSELKRRKRRS